MHRSQPRPTQAGAMHQAEQYLSEHVAACSASSCSTTQRSEPCLSLDPTDAHPSTPWTPQRDPSLVATQLTDLSFRPPWIRQLLSGWPQLPSALWTARSTYSSWPAKSAPRRTVHQNKMRSLKLEREDTRSHFRSIRATTEVCCRRMCRGFDGAASTAQTQTRSERQEAF